MILPARFDVPKLAVSDYSRAYICARRFPDSKLEYESVSPFGHLEIYSSSYLHFAPGLSDNASLNLAEMPENAYLGLYIDGDGPIGVMRDVTAEGIGVFPLYLPMSYPVP